eukprot:6231676-Prymnesium_polylepis.1
MSKFKFAHRDLQDNNTMIKIVREPVTTCEDVEVYLTVDRTRPCASKLARTTRHTDRKLRGLPIFQTSNTHASGN